MSIDLAPEELDEFDTSTITTLADAADAADESTADESSADASSEMWIPTYIKDVIDALDFSGIPEFGSIMVKEIDSWSDEVRAAVIAWCRQPVDDSTPDLAMPDVLQQYLPVEEEEEDAVAECDAASMPSIPSTALVPVDAIASDSAPADSTASSDAMQLPSTIVDVVTEAEFAERLDSKMNEFAADIQALDAWMTRVHAATAETDEAERTYLGLKEQASEAKKVYEAKVIALRSITRSQPGPQREFPFAGEQGAADAEPSTQAESATPTQTRSPDEPAVTMSQEKLDAAADERSWRAWPLDHVEGLFQKCIKALAAMEVTTVGQLSDYQAKHGDYWVKNTKGLGKTGSDNVSDSMERFWRERPDRKRQAGAA